MLELKNPVMTASGTFGYGTEFEPFMDIERLGGIVVKGTTLNPRQGNPYPRMTETPAGMLNAVGLQNKGVHHFADHIYPQIKDINTKILVNVSGSTIARASGSLHRWPYPIKYLSWKWHLLLRLQRLLQFR